MAIVHGKKRVVITLPSLGIVLKFPKIRLMETLKIVLSVFKKGNREYVWYFLTEKKEVGLVSPTFKYYIFGGILENWREFVFFMKTEHIFLQETYFSLFGFMNIQKFGKSTIWYDSSFENMMGRFLGEDFQKDSHHFSSQRNFSWEAGRLKIVDYGSLECREVIEKHGARLYEEFARS